MEFKKTNESVNETFMAENEGYRYRADVIKMDGKLDSVTVIVYKKLENGEQYAGQLILKNGSKSANFPQGEDVIPHVTVFEAFLDNL